MMFELVSAYPGYATAIAFMISVVVAIAIMAIQEARRPRSGRWLK
jgi:hypothetical protein